tara:strand:+ start:1132 stop:2157 length:1026 start_codon:yes stop_codon:yes gene_type:complete
MGINTILTGITGFISGQPNTAEQLRDVLFDITGTFSATTLDDVTTEGNVTSNTIGVSGLTTGYIQMNTTAPTIPSLPGQLHWNVTDDTLDLHANNVTYQIGQEIAPLVRNSTGSLITNGTPVMFAGTNGNSGRILIQPAIANGSIPSSYVLGATTEDIANGQDGHVTWFGKIRAIDTTGTDVGEVWNDSDILYVSPFTGGTLTNIKPEAPYPQIFMGVVINAHANTGTLFVRPSWRGNLTDLADINGTPLSGTGQLCVWDDARELFDFTSNINDFLLTGTTTEFGGTIKTKEYTVATLPSGTQGDRAHVSDANATTFYSIVAGGGSNVVPVFYNGTNWVIA